MISVYELAPDTNTGAATATDSDTDTDTPKDVKCKCGKLFNDFSEFETEYVSALRQKSKYDDDEAKYLHTQTCQSQAVELIARSFCNRQLASGKWQVI